jgi:hypothetical protein
MFFAYTYSPIGTDSVDALSTPNGFLASRLWILIFIVILILLAFFYQNEIVEWKNRQKANLKAYIKKSFFQVDSRDDVSLYEDGIKGLVWEYIDQHLLPDSDTPGYFDFSLLDSDTEDEIIVENMQTKGKDDIEATEDLEKTTDEPVDNEDSEDDSEGDSEGDSEDDDSEDEEDDDSEDEEEDEV